MPNDDYTDIYINSMESSKNEMINNVSSERNRRKIDKNSMNLSRIGSTHDLGSNLEV